MNQKLADWASVAEITSGVAVVITLVFLVLTSTVLLLSLFALGSLANGQEASPVVEVFQSGYRYGGSIYSNIEDLAAVLGDASVTITVAECGSDQKLMELLQYLRDQGAANVAFKGSVLDCSD